MSLGSAFRVLQAVASRAPHAVELADAVVQARAGKIDQARIRRAGFNTLRPGAGEHAEDIVRSGRRMAALLAGRDPGLLAPADVDPQLDAFLRWYADRTWGNYINLGPLGGGKTGLALRSGEIWRQNHAAAVLGLDMYEDDGLPGIQTLDVGTLELMADVIRFDNARRGTKFLSEFMVEPGRRKKWTSAYRAQVASIPIGALKRKTIILNEASLELSGNGQDAATSTLIEIQNAARHMEWNVILNAQTAGMLGLRVFKTDVVFVKEPQGDEKWTDRPNQPQIGALWVAAEAGFKSLAAHPYRRRYPHNVAWAYVRSAIFTGMCPFDRPGVTGQEVARV